MGHMLTIPGYPRKEDCREFKASLGTTAGQCYTAKPCLKKDTHTQKKTKKNPHKQTNEQTKKTEQNEA